jgi:hypothetical protein
VVVTATDSNAQQFETVFPEYFVTAFADPAADADRNGKVSIWEAFTYASAAVRRWYEQHDQLATERPLIDDTGGGVGREAQNPGNDGYISRNIFLGPDTPVAAPAAGGADAALLGRRTELAAELGRLQAGKATTPPADYLRDLERVLTEMAHIAGEMRTRP